MVEYICDTCAHVHTEEAVALRGNTEDNKQVQTLCKTRRTLELLTGITRTARNATVHATAAERILK